MIYILQDEQYNLVDFLKSKTTLSSIDKKRLSECLFDFLASVLLATKIKVGKDIIRQNISDKSSNYAFVLAYLAELTEYSHGHHKEAGHIGSSTLPVTLALAKETISSQENYSIATVYGYEAVARFGQAIMPDLKREWGSNATGFCGPVASSVVASQIYEYPIEATVSSLGIASYLTPFNPQDGYITSAHGLETGLAVSLGILSTKLSYTFASNSMKGPENILDKYYKRLKNKNPSYLFQEEDNEIQDITSIHNLYFKPYPCCRATHGAVQGVEELVNKGVKKDEIDNIQILTSSNAANITGKLPSKTNLDYIDRQFSMQYLAAAALDGDNIEDIVFWSDKEKDSKRLEFAQNNISIAIKDDLSNKDERFGTIIQAWLKDGTVKTSEVLFPYGSLKKPMHFEDIVNKFDQVALDTIGEENDGWKKDILELNWELLSKKVFNYLVSI